MYNLYFGTIFTESQNNCKGPQDCVLQLPCSKQGQLKQVAWGCVQLGFNYLQGQLLSKDSTASGKPVPAFSHPHIPTEFLVFQFVPFTCCCSVTSHHWEEFVNNINK